MKPILFNTEMVKAILEGRKTVTRRIIKKVENDWSFLELTNNAAITKVNTAGEEYPFDVDGLWATFECDYDPHYPMVKSPYEVGDILYVRETWRVRNVYGDFAREGRVAEIEFKAGGKNSYMNIYEDSVYSRAWRPSIHMPKEVARIFLRVTDVRVERLQEAKNLRLEGVKTSESCDDCFITCNKCNPENSPTGCDNEVKTFAELWDSTVKPSDVRKYGWNVNPYVWVIEFERCDKQEE